MSKIGQIIKKNLLLLVRSRSSAFVILFGPLVIILLIGFAFSNSSSGDFIVGYYNPDDAELTSKFVANMELDGFIVKYYPQLSSCIEEVKVGSLQTCISFPKNFSIENNKTNNIIFYVDQSRTNFVYQIIDSISTNLGVASADLSEDLTNNILKVLWSSEEDIKEAIETVVKLKASTSSIASDANKASESADDIDFDVVDVDTDVVKGYFDTMTLMVQNLRVETNDFIDSAKDLKGDLNTNSYNSTDFTNFQSALDDIESFVETSGATEDTNIDNFDDAFSELEDALDGMNNKLSDAQDDNNDVIDKIKSVKKSVEKIKDGLDDLKSLLEKVNSNINSLKVTSSQTITNPISTSIESVSGNNNKLVFMFPYLIMLVVMFVGLLLSGTLVIMEKNSKSSFRTFCTPVKDELLMVSNFLTSFIVLLIQMVIIIGIAYFFLGDILFSNIPVAGGLLFLGMVFFIILGMAIGYLMSSQEAVTMIAISFGSVSLFLSNLILPLETLSEELQRATLFNPYVITSEALRKALVFNTSYLILQKEIITLGLYSIIVFCLLIIVRHIIRSDFYSHIHLRSRGKIFEDPSDMYLKIDDIEIKNLKEFAAWLENVDNKTFKRNLIWKDVREWMKNNHMKRWLRVKIAGKSREQMNSIIEKHLDKVRKT